MSGGDWAWTYDGVERASESARVFVPDVKLLPARHLRLEPLRGHTFSLAAFELETGGRRCVGWVDVEATGHANVREWIKATGWKPKEESRA